MRSKVAAGIVLALAVGGLVWAEERESAPAEADITFVEEGQGGEAGEGAESPFAAGEESGVRKDAVPGYVELSSGAKVAGRIFTTRAKRVKIYNLQKEIYEYVPVPAVRKIETLVEWERMEKEWRFKEAGSPEKVYTGRSYPARKFAYRLTLVGGHTITGHILGQPLYLARPSRASPSRASGSSDGSNDEGKTDRFILHDRQKGPPDTTLEDLVYIRSVTLGRDAYEEAGQGNAESGKARDAGTKGRRDEGTQQRRTARARGGEWG